MGDMQNISRRAFIVGSAAVAGGVAFGSYSDAEAACRAGRRTIRWPPASGPNSVELQSVGRDQPRKDHA